MSRPKIVIADDSLTIQKVFELALEDEDVEALIVGDGISAFDLALEMKPRIVIADAHMPGLDGFQLCHALAQDPDTAGCPVYLLASSLDEFDEEKAELVGAAGKFEKPFRSEEIVPKILKAINDALDNIEEDHTFDDVAEPLDRFMDDTGETNKVDEEPANQQKLAYGERVTIPPSPHLSPEDRMLKALEEETDSVDDDESFVDRKAPQEAPEESLQKSEVDEEVIRAMVEEIVEKTINDLGAIEILRESVADSVGEAIAEMKPEIIEAVEKIATSQTLAIAGDMIRKTIEQIMSDK